MNPLLRKAILSAVLCSFTLITVRGAVHAEGAPAADVKSTMSAEAGWKENVRATANIITTVKAEKGDTYSDLAFLQPILADKRIVSLGEASHGATEYNSVKVRLIKYLHEKLGYNVIAFESNLADAAAAYTQVQEPEAATDDGELHLRRMAGGRESAAVRVHSGAEPYRSSADADRV